MYGRLLSQVRVLSKIKSIRLYSSNVEGLEVSTEGKIFKIQLSRPEKFNALTWDMYRGWIEALKKSNADDKTSVTVVTGTGDYYCSGNDLSNFSKNVKSPDDLIQMADDGEKILKEFVDAHITHEKPLISLVNGPAIGIVVTTLALYDMVIATDKATFAAPFTVLGQSPEGCSSYTFPILMGHSKACDVLLFDKVLSAAEAFERNLVTRIIPHRSFQEGSNKILQQISEMPIESLRVNKVLVRNATRDQLLKINAEECKLLKERWLSPECIQAISKFMKRRK